LHATFCSLKVLRSRLGRAVTFCAQNYCGQRNRNIGDNFVMLLDVALSLDAKDAEDAIEAGSKARF